MTDFLISPCEYKFSEGAAPGEFEGYASTFTVDQGGDLIRPGAFQKTLQTDPTPKMYLNHAGVPFKTTTASDLIPIGIWMSILEDSAGLAVKGRLSDLDTDQGRRIHSAMKDGRLCGLSIGYKATRVTRGTKAGQPLRTIHECKLREISIVSEPMNSSAVIRQVKGGVYEEIKSPDDLALFIEQNIGLIAFAVATKGWKEAIRDFEGLMLRDGAGFSHAAAKSIAAGGFKAKQSEPRDEDGVAEHIASRMKRLAEMFAA